MKKFLSNLLLALCVATFLLTSCTEQVAPDPAPVVLEESTNPINIDDVRSTEGEEEDSTRYGEGIN